MLFPHAPYTRSDNTECTCSGPNELDYVCDGDCAHESKRPAYLNRHLDLFPVQLKCQNGFMIIENNTLVTDSRLATHKITSCTVYVTEGKSVLRAQVGP